MQVARITIANLSTRFGATLKLPPAIDGARLLWALAGNESSFGLNCSPRHEAGYCRGGKYYDPDVTELWGCLAHCSYGPWQVMYANISRGNISPLDIAIKPDFVANAAVQFIQSRIIGLEKATTVEEIAEAYNSGDWRDELHPNKAIPEKYIADLVKNYAVPLGELV